MAATTANPYLGTTGSSYVPNQGDASGMQVAGVQASHYHRADLDTMKGWGTGQHQNGQLLSHHHAHQQWLGLENAWATGGMATPPLHGAHDVKPGQQSGDGSGGGYPGTYHHRGPGQQIHPAHAAAWTNVNPATTTPLNMSNGNPHMQQSHYIPMNGMLSPQYGMRDPYGSDSGDPALDAPNSDEEQAPSSDDLEAFAKSFKQRR